MTPILSIRGLAIGFRTRTGTVPALRGVDLDIAPGTCVGLVGESGSGKSLTALATLGLLPPGARVESGQISFRGRDLLGMRRDELDSVRGREIAMVFQEPMSALNPVMTIGRQIEAPLRRHLGLDAAAAHRRAAELLAQVGIPSPEARLGAYPHQLSGGMRQRAMIAMALSCNPALLVADEPTTALDGTIQAQILSLLMRLRSELGLAVLIITHDFGVVAEIADTVAVMYAGRIVEHAPVEDLFDAPAHPYAAGLLAATPTLEAPMRRRLPSITGAVPHLADLHSGCAFQPRCPARLARCATIDPAFTASGPRRGVACHAPVLPAPGAGGAVPP
jgi:oligopeptide/dipeptide ABC transporter ATP-binding protein